MFKPTPVKAINPIERLKYNFDLLEQYTKENTINTEFSVPRLDRQMMSFRKKPEEFHPKPPKLIVYESSISTSPNPKDRHHKPDQSNNNIHDSKKSAFLKSGSYDSNQSDMHPKCLNTENDEASERFDIYNKSDELTEEENLDYFVRKWSQLSYLESGSYINITSGINTQIKSIGSPLEEKIKKMAFQKFTESHKNIDRLIILSKRIFKLVGLVEDEDFKIYRTFLKTEFGWITTFEGGFNNPEPKKKILFIHGFYGSMCNWYLMVPYLIKQGYHVYAIDMYGMGSSYHYNPEHYETYHYSSTLEQFDDQIGVLTKTIEDWRRQIGLNNFYIIAHSMGGFITMHY